MELVYKENRSCESSS